MCVTGEILPQIMVSCCVQPVVSPLFAHLPEHLNPLTPTEGFLTVTTFSFGKKKKALSVMLPVAHAFMSVADRKPILTCPLFLCYEGLEH